MFPSLITSQPPPSKLLNSSQGLFSSQTYSSAQFNEASFRNFADSSFNGEHAFKSSLNNSLLNPDTNPFSLNRKPFMNKSPIEIHKKHLF